MTRKLINDLEALAAKARIYSNSTITVSQLEACLLKHHVLRNTKHQKVFQMRIVNKGYGMRVPDRMPYPSIRLTINYV